MSVSPAEQAAAGKAVATFLAWVPADADTYLQVDLEHARQSKTWDGALKPLLQIWLPCPAALEHSQQFAVVMMPDYHQVFFVRGVAKPQLQTCVDMGQNSEFLAVEGLSKDAFVIIDSTSAKAIAVLEGQSYESPTISQGSKSPGRLHDELARLDDKSMVWGVHLSQDKSAPSLSLTMESSSQGGLAGQLGALYADKDNAEEALLYVARLQKQVGSDSSVTAVSEDGEVTVKFALSPSAVEKLVKPVLNFAQ